MNNEHPITPPLELVHQWVDMLSSRSDHAVFSLAARWGANQELEATLKLMTTLNIRGVDYVRNARRSALAPSRKEQALEAIGRLYASVIHDDLKNDAATIRRALEQLND